MTDKFYKIATALRAEHDIDESLVYAIAELLESVAIDSARAMFEEPEHGHYRTENDGIWTFHPIRQPCRNWLNDKPPGGPKKQAEAEFREWIKSVLNK